MRLDFIPNLDALSPEQRSEFFLELSKQVAIENEKKYAQLKAWVDQYGQGPGGWKFKCQHCGQEFYARMSLAKLCSCRCLKEAWIERRRNQRIEDRKKRCHHCGASFTAKRTHTKFCSGACRQAHHRKRKAESVTDLSEGNTALTVKRNTMM